MGFSLERSYGRSGAMGLSEDYPALAKALMLRQDATSLPARAWWRAVDKLITPVAQHTRYVLFRKA